MAGVNAVRGGTVEKGDETVMSLLFRNLYKPLIFPPWYASNKVPFEDA